MTAKKMDGRELRNVRWRQMAMGDRAGSPLAEWAYYTDEFPDGLPESRIVRVDPDAQMRLCRFWLNSNFRPFLPTNWAQYFGFAGSGGSGFDRGAFAPQRFSAKQLLEKEFGNHILNDVILHLADELPPWWVWRSDTEAGATPETRHREVLSALGRVETILASYDAALHRAHNNPPEPLSDQLSPAEVAEVRQLLDYFRETKARPTPAEAPAVKPELVALEQKTSRIRKLRDRAETAITNSVVNAIIKELAPALIQLVHYIYAWLQSLSGLF